MKKVEHLEVKLSEIDGKVNLASEEIKLLREILSVNTEQLRVHLDSVEQTKKLIEIKEKDISDRLVPIEDHVKFINKLTKLLAWSIALPGSIYYVIKIVELLK